PDGKAGERSRRQLAAAVPPPPWNIGRRYVVDRGRRRGLARAAGSYPQRHPTLPSIKPGRYSSWEMTSESGAFRAISSDGCADIRSWNDATRGAKMARRLALGTNVDVGAKLLDVCADALEVRGAMLRTVEDLRRSRISRVLSRVVPKEGASETSQAHLQTDCYPVKVDAGLSTAGRI
ncbi:hypothetical protein ACHAWF_010232, partial [Thalassiosira exigua]